MNSEKKERKTLLSVLGRTRRPDPACLSQPARPPLGPSGQEAMTTAAGAPPAILGVRATARPLRPYKGAAQALRARCLVPQLRCLCPACAAAGPSRAARCRPVRRRRCRSAAPSPTGPSRGRQELCLAELDLLSLSPRPEVRRSVAVHREPEPAALPSSAGRIAAAPPLPRRR
jgi:hypothetical protein